MMINFFLRGFSQWFIASALHVNNILLILVSKSFDWSGRANQEEFQQSSLVVLVMLSLLTLVEYTESCCFFADMIILALALSLLSSNEIEKSDPKWQRHICLSVFTGTIVANLYRFIILPYQHYHTMSVTFVTMFAIGYVSCCVRRVRDCGKSPYHLCYLFTIIMIPKVIFLLSCRESDSRS